MSFMFKERSCINNQTCLIGVSGLCTFLVHGVGPFAFYWKKLLRCVAFYFYLLGPAQSPHVSILWKKLWARSSNN